MSNFKVKGVGLDITNLREYYSYSSESINYIHTTLGSGNEFNCAELVRKYKEMHKENLKFIVTVNKLSELTVHAVHTLLQVFDLGKVDLMFIDADCEIENNVEVINSLVKNKLVDNFGISNPKNQSTLKKLVETMEGILSLENPMKYVSLPVNPLYFDLELLNWAKEKEINIFGFNPFGGHISSGAVIDSFSVPYLLGFAAMYSDVVVLSCRGDKYDRSTQQADYIMALRNRPDSEDVSKYILTKSTKKLYKPLNKLIFTSLGITEDSSVSYNDPELISSPDDLSFNFGYPVSNYSDNDTDRTEYKVTIANVNDGLLSDVVGKSKGNIGEANLILKSRISALLPNLIQSEAKLKARVKGANIKVVVTSFEVTDTITVFGAYITTTKKGWFGREVELSHEAEKFMLICTDDKIKFTSLNSDFVSPKV